MQSEPNRIPYPRPPFANGPPQGPPIPPSQASIHQQATPGHPNPHFSAPPVPFQAPQGGIPPQNPPYGFAPPRPTSGPPGPPPAFSAPPISNIQQSPNSPQLPPQSYLSPQRPGPPIPPPFSRSPNAAPNPQFPPPFNPYPQSQAPPGPPVPTPPSFGASPPPPPPPSTSKPLYPPNPSFPGVNSSAVSRLAEDFQSLSVQPAPGSTDSGLDLNALPRPISSPDTPQTVGPTNAHPRYVRLTTNVMPNAQSLRARWHLPLGAVVQPLAEPPPGEEVPVVNFGPTGIVRCRRCRTYINPFATFVDGGRRWRCNVCSLLNEVPSEYFCILDSSGRRQDASERPELSQGSVEFEAPAEYMVRPPMPPSFFFLIDVSAPAAQSGMLKVMCETIKSSLDSLPGHPRTQIGFLSFDSQLHFYHLKSSLSQPQVLVVGDMEEPFLPLPDDLLVNLSESRPLVDQLLDSLPSMFANSTCPESALGPALKASYLLMNRLGGKILLFQNNLPSVGVGRLRLRGEDPKLYGSEREHTVRVTEDPFYKTMAADFSRVQVSVNVFAFSAHYSDLASIGTLARYTSGQLYYYPGFEASRDGEKFSTELKRDLTRETAWEAVMRIRCGKGLKISSFHGHFFVRSMDLLALPAVSCDQSFAVQISHEENLLTTDTVYLQCALLYTSSAGVRRIRVHTMAAPVVADLGAMYKGADGAAMASVLSKIAIDKSLTGRLEDSRELIRQKLVQGLKEYKALHQAIHKIGGRLIYPESLKLLPLYVLGLTKTPALLGGFREVKADERSWAMSEIMSMSVKRLLKLLYPLLLRLDTMAQEAGTVNEDGTFVLPQALPLLSAMMDVRGVFLIDDGLKIWIWVGKQAPEEFVKQLTGGQDPGDKILQPNGTEISSRVFAIVNHLRSGSSVHQQVFLTGPGDSSEAYFFEKLMEDRSLGSISYPDFVVNLYRQVQQK